MKKSVIAIVLALVMSLACLTGCGQNASAPASGTEIASGGVLILSVNPEIAVEYDEKGHVTGVTARNDDAIAIIDSCEGLIGKETRSVVTELVNSIGEAGYFVEEVEGEPRQITIEIEAGSKLPNQTFLDDVVADVRSCVSANAWNVPTDVQNESDYGITDYVDTDYGPNSDGVTNYGSSNYGDTNYGNSNYGNSNYGDSNYDDGGSDYSDGDSGYDD